MADFSEYIHLLKVSAEPFARVRLNGAPFSGDASLGRAAVMRLWQEERRAVELLLEKLGVTLYVYDIAEDALYFRRSLPRGECQERKVRGYAQLLRQTRDGKELESCKWAEAFLQATEREMTGTVRMRAAIFDESPCGYELAFRSIVDAAGKVAAVTGYLLPDQAEGGVQAREDERYRSTPKLYRGDDLRNLVNAYLAKLQSGEKGVLFLLSLDSPAPDSGGDAEAPPVGGIVEAIRADFRSEDVLGQAAANELVLFMCGATSIDIIERRAQRIIDLCRRVPVRGRELAYNIGIAASGLPGQDYGVLLHQAREALELAQRHGSNQYRLYEETRY